MLIQSEKYQLYITRKDKDKIAISIRLKEGKFDPRSNTVGIFIDIEDRHKIIDYLKELK